MSELLTCISVCISLSCMCIVGCAFMICDKISGLTHEILELRMDLKRGEDDE